jgi:hypothetical protein
VLSESLQLTLFITKPDHLQTAPPRTQKSRNDQSNESREKPQGEAHIAYGCGNHGLGKRIGGEANHYRKNRRLRRQASRRYQRRDGDRCCVGVSQAGEGGPEEETARQS